MSFTKKELKDVADLMAERSTRRGWFPFPLTRWEKRRLANRFYETLLADPGPFGPIIDG